MPPILLGAFPLEPLLEGIYSHWQTDKIALIGILLQVGVVGFGFM